MVAAVDTEAAEVAITPHLQAFTPVDTVAAVAEAAGADRKIPTIPFYP